MNQTQTEALSPRITQALDELMDLIRTHYPDAQFEIEDGADDSEAVHLLTTVDIKDQKNVIDLVIDRLLKLQVEERLPIHVIPLRPPARVFATEQSSTPRSGAVLGNRSPL